MWFKLLICALALSSVVCSPAKPKTDGIKKDKITVKELEKEIISKVESETGDKESVQVIELSPELETNLENLEDEIVEIVRINADGTEEIQDISVKELLEDETDEVDEEAKVDDRKLVEEPDNVAETTTDFISDIESPAEDTAESFDDNSEEAHVTEEPLTHELITDFDQINIEEIIPKPLEPQIKNTEVIVNKENIVPLLKTLILASTHKNKPSFQDVLKAGALSAVKTSLDYMGKEKMSNTILKLLKEYTNILSDDDSTDDDLVMAELAEDYIKDHKFKVLLPESFFLDKPEMEQLLTKKKSEKIVKPDPITEFTIGTGRQADVTTVLSVGPLAWLGVIGGMLTIPYFMSEDETERSDRPGPLLRPPQVGGRLRPPQIVHRHPQAIPHSPGKVRPVRFQYHPDAPTPAPGNFKDPAYQQYRREYDEWYRQWYAHHFGQNNEDQKPVVVDPQQNPANQFQKVSPHQNPLNLVPPPLQNKNIVNQQPQHQSAPNPNSFGTFVPESQKSGNTHFGVTHIDGTGKPVPVQGNLRYTSPRPVYISTQKPTVKATVQKPKPVEFSPPKTTTLLKESPVKKTIPKKQFGNKAIDSVAQPSALVRNTPLSVQIVTSVPYNFNAGGQKFGDLETDSGFKPLVSSGGLKLQPAPSFAPQVVPSLNPKIVPKFNARPAPQSSQNQGSSVIPTSPPQISGITSGVFKTSVKPTEPAATTPTYPAVYVRKETDTKVRVVTSKSVVTSPPFVQKEKLPELKRPQRHQQSQRPQQNQVQLTDNSIVTNGHQHGFIKTNIPTKIRVVDNFRKTSPPTEAPTTTTTPTPDLPIYALDPFYGPKLSRVDAIFHQLNQKTEGCREQVVCNMYKNPDFYTPLSDFLSRQLTLTMDEIQHPQTSDPRIVRFFRYLKAAKLGQDGNNCAIEYPDCSSDTSRLSHRPIFDAHKKVSVLMNNS